MEKIKLGKKKEEEKRKRRANCPACWIILSQRAEKENGGEFP